MFYGLELQQGDRILTSQHEYSSNFTAFLQARRTIALVSCMQAVRCPHLVYSNQLIELSFLCNPAPGLVFKPVCKPPRPMNPVKMHAWRMDMHNIQCIISPWP